MSERRIVVDPVTRIEGHLRVQAVLGDDGKIVDSMSTGTMWRGLEVILKGRDPRDAWAASARAFTPLPPSARLRTRSESRFRRMRASSATF